MSIADAHHNGFEAVTEVAADDRARIALAKAGVRASDRFLLSTRASGEILLTPVASIPKRELIAWENAAVRASLQLGIAEAQAGLAKPDADILNELGDV
jgi:hypothetical protein